MSPRPKRSQRSTHLKQGKKIFRLRLRHAMDKHHHHLDKFASNVHAEMQKPAVIPRERRPGSEGHGRKPTRRGKEEEFHTL